MNIADVQGEQHEQHTLELYEQGSRKVYTVDREIPFPEGKLIVSLTDTKGIITQTNRAFVEMSGYERDELIGQAHSILRHPEMPAVAFKGLWDDVDAGKKWHGYVKNLRKDGAYYWVYATVVANVRNGNVVGYTSVRRKPSRTKIEECIKLYKELKDGEA